MYTRFHRLAAAELTELVAFVGKADLRVKGLDPGPLRHYRGGFAPILTLGLSAMVFYFGKHLELPTFVWVTAPSLMVAWGIRRIWQDARAVRRSRNLLEQDLHWYAMAWSQEMFCYRSWEECVLEPWAAITDIHYFPADGDGPLAGSLWVHFGRWQRLPVHEQEGSFAGRKLDSWYRDLVAHWTARTGRTPSEESRYPETS